MKCEREKSSTSVTVFQVILIIAYIVSFALIIVAIGLFGDAQVEAKNLSEDGQLTECILFVTSSNTNPSKSNCNYFFAGQSLAAVGLGVLIILAIVKTALGLIKNNAFLAADIILLVLTSIFAVSATVVIWAGWFVTCFTLGIDSIFGYDSCSDLPIQSTASGALAFSFLACIAIFVSFVIYLVFICVSRCCQSK